MAKATNKTHTDPPPAHTDSKDNRKTTKKSNSKGDSNKVPNPNVKSEAPNSRPKRAVTKSSNQEQHPPAKSQTDSRSRKRQADQANEQPQNTPDTPEAAAELEAQRPTKKSKKATSTGSGEPLSSTTTSNVKGTKKKASSNGSGKAAKENVPPPPAATTSKSKKPTAAERREQQLNAADHSALEQRIKELEAQNADHLRAMERLQRKNKRLNHTATQLASSVADTKTDQVIKEPETAKYSLQDEMGLANDTKTYTRIQASTIGRTVRELSRRVLNFDQPWKSQDPIAMGDLYRAAAEKEPFLRRFHHNWATTRLAQMYLRNTRSYVANIDIPESAVARRRATTTIKGAKEAGLPPPDLSKLKKKKKPATKDSGAILPEGTGNESSASTSQKAATGSSAKTKGQPGKSQPSKHSVDGNNSTSGLRKVTKPRDNSEVEDEAGAEDGLEDDYPLDRDSEDDDDDQGSENSEEDGGNYRGNGRADDEELEEVGEDGMRHSDDESAVSSDGCGDE